MLGTLTANSKFSSCAGSRGEPGSAPAVRSCLPSLPTQRGVGCLRTGTIPEELEAHSLPVSRSLSPSLVSVTAGVLEQDAPTTWCRRRRRPEHLDRGLCSAANSLAPSCKQSRRQERWQMTSEGTKAFPQVLGQALSCHYQEQVEEAGHMRSLQQVPNPASCLCCRFPLCSLRHCCLVSRGSLALNPQSTPLDPPGFLLCSFLTWA